MSAEQPEPHNLHGSALSTSSVTSEVNDDGHSAISSTATEVAGTVKHDPNLTAASVNEVGDSGSTQPTPQPPHSQRACTQCQRHKIKCSSDGSGPCIRCRKKGYLCHIAPRKKRVSKKAKDNSSAASPVNPNDVNNSDDEGSAMDHTHSRFNSTPPETRGDPKSLSVSRDEGATAKTYTSSLSFNNELLPEKATKSNDTDPAEQRPTQQPIAVTPSRNQRIREYMMQSTISSCDQYSVYLSLSFVCPELFRRMVDLDWQHNPTVFIPLNSANRPLFHSLVDSPTSPVYALTFQNDPVMAARVNLPVSEEANQQVIVWKQKYGETLLDVYFNLINPVQPIIHRRHFMAAYNANAESTVLLLAIFVVAVPYCSLGTLDDRRTLQTAFLHHIYANYSYKLTMPTMDAVQCLSLIADAAYDRGVLMPHSSAVAAAVEIRLHVDCSEWDIPGWERALRKALWWSLCIRDAWTILRFVGTPKVLLEYFDTTVPTAAELSQLTMHESDELSLAMRVCTVMVNNAPINVSMEACLRSFISVAKLSEVLLEINRALYQLRGLRLVRQQPAAAASHIAEALELQLQELMSSWARDNSSSGQEEMEPDLYRCMIYYFARVAIYCQFLPHRQTAMRTDRFMLDFYTRFLDSIQGILDTLNKFKRIKFSNYWPSWMSHVIVLNMFVLFDICIARIAMYIKANNIQKRKSGNGEDKPAIPMQHEQRRSILLDILNKDRFSSRVLKYSNDLVFTMGELGAMWEQPRDIYKTMLKTAKSFGLADVIDFSEADQWTQAESKQPPAMSQQQVPLYPTSSSAMQQTADLRYMAVKDSGVNSGPHMTSPSQNVGAPPLSSVDVGDGKHQTVMPPRNMQMLLSPMNANQSQPFRQPQQLSHERLSAIPTSQAQQSQPGAYYGNGESTLPQQGGYVRPFGGRMQQDLYEDPVHNGTGEPNGNNIVQNAGVFDDFFTNLSVNLFDGITDFHRDFVL